MQVPMVRDKFVPTFKNAILNILCSYSKKKIVACSTITLMYWNFLVANMWRNVLAMIIGATH